MATSQKLVVCSTSGAVAESHGNAQLVAGSGSLRRQLPMLTQLVLRSSLSQICSQFATHVSPQGAGLGQPHPLGTAPHSAPLGHSLGAPPRHPGRVPASSELWGGRARPFYRQEWPGVGSRPCLTPCHLMSSPAISLGGSFRGEAGGGGTLIPATPLPLAEGWAWTCDGRGSEQGQCPRGQWTRRIACESHRSLGCVCTGGQGLHWGGRVCTGGAGSALGGQERQAPPPSAS